MENSNDIAGSRDYTIVTINRKDAVQSFIENSTMGMQFSLIVLFATAKKNKKEVDKEPRKSFAFSSKEFMNTYSQIALGLGLAKHLIRSIAFPEFLRTLEYISLIRQQEITGEYECDVSYEDLQWLASIALPFVIVKSTLNKQTNQNNLQEVNNDNVRQILGDLITSNTFAFASNDKKNDKDKAPEPKMISPKSRDYGAWREYYSNKQPPTTYSFRTPNPNETTRLKREMGFEHCGQCGAQIDIDHFEIWIGEPIGFTPEQKQDERMTDILADSSIDNRSISDIIKNSDNLTEREILNLGYGIMPMDGRDAFIAFARPLQKTCQFCGYSIWNSVSISPNY